MMWSLRKHLAKPFPYENQGPNLWWSLFYKATPYIIYFFKANEGTFVTFLKNSMRRHLHSGTQCNRELGTFCSKS